MKAVNEMTQNSHSIRILINTVCKNNQENTYRLCIINKNNPFTIHTQS